MAFRLTWAPLARQDLRDLVAYIAEDSVRSARLFARGVFEAVEQLSPFPESGRVVPEFGDVAIREVFRRPCRIVYRIVVASQAVEIIRVWHAARGSPTLR